jgi:hypothetical protein
MNISSNAMMNAYSGIQTGLANFTQTSQQLTDPNQLDKTRALVQQKLDANLVEVNAKALKTADQIIGSLLDVMA